MSSRVDVPLARQSGAALDTSRGRRGMRVGLSARTDAFPSDTRRSGLSGELGRLWKRATLKVRRWHIPASPFVDHVLSTVSGTG